MPQVIFHLSSGYNINYHTRSVYLLFTCTITPYTKNMSEEKVYCNAENEVRAGDFAKNSNREIFSLRVIFYKTRPCTWIL